MADDDNAAPPGAPADRTVQVDALTDVELVDNEGDGGGEAEGAAAHDGEADAGGPAPTVSRAPPPLPPRKQRNPIAVMAAFGGVVVVMGGLAALGAHFLLPAAPVAVPAVAPPPPATVAPVAEPEPEVRHVRLDDEFVIGGPAPDAGPAAPP